MEIMKESSRKQRVGETRGNRKEGMEILTEEWQ